MNRIILDAADMITICLEEHKKDKEVDFDKLISKAAAITDEELITWIRLNGIVNYPDNLIWLIAIMMRPHKSCIDENMDYLMSNTAAKEEWEKCYKPLFAL